MSHIPRSMLELGPGNHSGENSTRNALLAQIASVELKMARTRAFLQEQSSERLRLYSKLNSLSPVDQLPAEIKFEIFYDALQSPPNNCAGEGKSPLITPFFLGKICRGWRDFVWSSPILWTNLHLCLSRNRCEAQTNLLRDWLSRAAKCPISFSLTTVDSYEAWISDPPIEILNVFASISAKWKEVEFFLPDTQDCFDAISAAENSLPLLTTATVHWLTEHTTERQLNLFSTAPQLSALYLDNLHLFKVLAPWHQLREFTSEASTVDEIRGLLHKVPDIIRCSFKNVVSMILLDDSDSQELGIFNRHPVLEHLEYLKLWFDSVDTTSSQILGPVKLPSLREVSLRGSFAYTGGILLPIMMSFHSSHLLEKFTIGGTVTDDEDLIQLLGNIPSIKDLCLDFHNQDLSDELLTEELLERLYYPHTDILLPNLRSFTYHGPTSLNEHMHLFRDVLVYRFRRCALPPTELASEQRTVCQLQSVTVTTSSKVVISPDIQEELDSLVQEGLVLSLTSTSLFT